MHGCYHLGTSRSLPLGVAAEGPQSELTPESLQPGEGCLAEKTKNKNDLEFGRAIGTSNTDLGAICL